MTLLMSRATAINVKLLMKAATQGTVLTNLERVESHKTVNIIVLICVLLMQYNELGKKDKTRIK